VIVADKGSRIQIGGWMVNVTGVVDPVAYQYVHAALIENHVMCVLIARP
jgi:hypothetical protein